MSVAVRVTDVDGNTVPAEPEPAPVWIPAMRFYRHSQSSRDLYDAYRSLWLGFETLLDSICAKLERERERDWLLRAISHVASMADLRSLVPSTCKHIAAYIVGTQYDHIRCRLFHSKPSKTKSPLDLPNPEDVSSAYESLIRIWRTIASQCLGVRPGASGAMTYAGFKIMLDNTLQDKLTAYVTDDPSPVTKEDTRVSPLDHPVYPFEKLTYLSETSPGRVSFVASQGLHGAMAPHTVRRICSMAGNVLLTASTISDALELSGADCVESYQSIRLVNRDLPRTLFGANS
jgi:hypothetical protein